MPERTIEEIMRDKAAGRRNELGDYWSDYWCGLAADKIAKLEEALRTIDDGGKDAMMWDRDGNLVEARSFARAALYPVCNNEVKIG